jgi:hypothetical protein
MFYPASSWIRTRNLVVIGTDCIGNYKSNYHTITTTKLTICSHRLPHSQSCSLSGVRIRVMSVVNATCNNSSVILWCPTLFVEEIGVLGENHLPATSQGQIGQRKVVELPNKWLDSKDRVGNYNAGYVIFNVGDIGLRIDKGRNNHVHHCIAVVEW